MLLKFHVHILKFVIAKQALKSYN